MKKRILSALLALCMVSTLLVPVAAEPGSPSGSDQTAPSQVEVISHETIDLNPIVTSADPVTFFSLAGGTVDLKASNEIKWFDRLSPDTTGTNYQEIADNFYAALKNAATLGGSDDYLIEDKYFSQSGTDSSTTDNLETLTPGQFVHANYTFQNGTAEFTAIFFGKVPSEEKKYATNLMTAVHNAFDRDCPEVFWLSGNSRAYQVSTQVSTTESIYLFFLLAEISSTGEATDCVRQSGYNEAKIKTELTNRENYVSTIKNSISGYADLDPAGKIKAFDSWLTKNNGYNTSPDLENGGTFEMRECISALQGLAGATGPVCEGYARAFKVLCDSENIPCILVSGDAASDPNKPDETGPHMWNNVQIGDKWYCVDVTWDDPGASEVKNSGNENQSWLLVGTGDMIQGMTFTASHAVTNTVAKADESNPDLVPVGFTNSPELSATKYVAPNAKTDLEVKTAPTAENAVYGETLQNVTLNTAAAVVKAKDAAEGDVAIPGTWAWKTTTQSVGNVADSPKTFTAVFTPNDADNYNSVEADITVTVQPKNISGATIDDISDQTYTGSEIKPEVVVKDGTEVLTQGTDYTVSYSSNTAVGTNTATVTVTGSGNYTGTATKNFTIVRKPGSITIADPGTITYDGTAVTAGTSSADLTYTYNGDGTVTVKWYKGSEALASAPKDAGTYEIGVSAAAGTNTAAVAEVRTSFTISPKNISSAAIGPISDQTYTGSALTPAVTVTDGTPLVLDTDYTVGYSSNIDVGTATVTVTGKGNYTGTKTATFKITNLPGQTVTFTDVTNGAVSATYGDADITHTATSDKGGTITYSSSNSAVATVDNTGTVTIKSAGTAVITATAAAVAGQYGSGSAAYTLTVNPKELDDLTITAIPDQTYTGSELKPAVTVTSASEGKTLVQDTDYTVAYSANTNVGTATVTVTAKGNYSGNATQTFQIVKGIHAALDPINLSHRYNATGTGEYDLSALVDGATRYTVGTVTDAKGIVSNVTVTDGKLTYTRNAQTEDEVGSTATFTVTIESANWVDIGVTVTIKLSDKENQAALTVTSTSVTFPNTLTLTTSGGSGTGAVTYTVADGTGKATVTAGVLTPTKAGTVTVTATKAGDGDYEAVTSAPATVTIAKGTPTAVPTYTAITASGKTLADANLGVSAAGTVPPGTIAWDDPTTTAVSANTSYRWTFTPTDAENWNTAAGSIVLWSYTPPTRPSGGGSGDSSSSDSGSSGNGTVTTGSSTSSGERVTATTAAPSVTTSNGTASAAVSDSMGQRIVDQAVRNGSDTVVIAPKMDRTVRNIQVSIPANTLRDIGSRTNADLKVNSPVANVTIPNAALISLASGSGLTVSTSSRDGVVSVDVASNGGSVRQVPGGLTAEVFASRCTSGTVAMLVASDGSSTVIRKSIADPAAGTVSVPLDGSARLVIANNGKSFADLPSTNWAASAVEFISGHEIMNGTDGASFSPSAPMTRGMLAVVLHNIESNPQAAGSVAFADVGSTWYTEAVQWAAGQGIVSGYNDGRFAPDDMVTREQLAVMLYRYAGQPKGSASTLNFADVGQVSAWAEDAIRWAVGAGILSGDGSRLNPDGQATRAEAASMLMRFMMIMSK